LGGMHFHRRGTVYLSTMENTSIYNGSAVSDPNDWYTVNGELHHMSTDFEDPKFGDDTSLILDIHWVVLRTREDADKLRKAELKAKLKAELKAKRKAELRAELRAKLKAKLVKLART
jgi:hypothetical protein